MPGLMTMIALAPSPCLLVKPRFCTTFSKETPVTTMLLFKKRSSSSAHLHRRSWAARAAATAATAATDPHVEQKMMERLAEDGWVDEHMLPLLTPVEDAWQPADLLPSFAASADEQHRQVAELQAPSSATRSRRKASPPT
ncbi:unnamed protein product [Urochloa humidicola]